MKRQQCSEIVLKFSKKFGPEISLLAAGSPVFLLGGQHLENTEKFEFDIGQGKVREIRKNIQSPEIMVCLRCACYHNCDGHKNKCKLSNFK